MKKEKSELISCSFRIDPAIYQRFKTIALAEKKSVNTLICEMIKECVDSTDPEELVRKVMGIDPSERLTILYKQQADND